MKRLSFLHLLFLIPVACNSAQDAGGDDGKLRVMTYNIQWFSEDSDPVRIKNIKEILDKTTPDIVGLQEIQSKKALRQVFDDSWSIGIQDDPKQFQEVAIAVRKPYKLVKTELLFTSPALDFAFPGNRDVLRAEVETPEGEKVFVYVNHLKSRRGGRWVTDQQREQAAGMLAGYLAAMKGENSIVLGDMNDSPDDRCVNILESGNTMAPGGASEWPKPLLHNLCEPLYRKNFVSIDLNRLFKGEALSPVVPGAYNSNEELRGKEHKFPDDVKVTQALFDQILVSPSLFGKLEGKAFIYTEPNSMKGSNGRIQMDEGTGNVTYTEKGTRASDHQPVYADFVL